MVKRAKVNDQSREDFEKELENEEENQKDKSVTEENQT